MYGHGSSLEFYYLIRYGIEVVNRTIRTRAQEKRNGIEKYTSKGKTSKVILQLNAAINKYVLHILTLTIFVS
jgi:hypothetical protein